MRITVPGIGIGVFLVMVGSAATAFALDEVLYESLVDRRQVVMGQTVQYLVLVQYALDTMAPTIETPSFDRFTVLREYQTTQDASSEGVKHLILKKRWLLQPQEPGHLSIAAAIVTYQDPTTNLLRTGKTQVQFVDVSPTAEAATPAVASNRSVRTGGAAGWLWGAAGAGVLALVLGLTRRRGHRPQAPTVRPEDEALQALDRSLTYLEQEHPDQYYAALTRALRDYLQTKFALDAEALPTPMLLATLGDLGFAPDHLRGLERFFQTAEKAKFAGFVPDEAEMLALHRTVQGVFEAGRRVAARSPSAEKLRPKRHEEDEDA